MDSTYTFRHGNSKDLSQIKDLTLISYLQFKEVLSKENAQAWETNLRDENTYEDLFKKAMCFVCEHEGKIVGSAFFIPRGNPYRWFESDWSYIRMVAVHPKYQGQGIGRKLTQQCIEFAKTSGEKILALHTSEFQNAARHIYENMGFEKQLKFELFDKIYWIYTMPLAIDTTVGFNFYRAGMEDLETMVDYRIRFAIELAGEQTLEKTQLLKNGLTSYFAKATSNNSCISFIAKWNGEVAGIGSMHVREMPGNFKNSSGKWGYIMNMFTVPKFRRKGVCKGILNLLVEEGRKYGITGFELHATKEGEFVYTREGFIHHNEPTLRKYF